MKKIILALFVVMQIAAVQSASAIPFTDQHITWPGWTNGTGDDIVDAIGSPDLKTGTATVTGSNLTGINISNSKAWLESTAGDLFINVLKSSNDTTWDYVVRTMGDTAPGTFAVYAVQLSSLLGVNDSAYNRVTYTGHREGTPWGLASTTGLTQVGTASFSGLQTGFAAYTNITGINLFDNNTQNPDNFIIGWTVSCGNDVLYEQVPVPEPGTMALLGFGMLGLAIFGKRRMNKEA